jgi:hypothetical protein
MVMKDSRGEHKWISRNPSLLQKNKTKQQNRMKKKKKKKQPQNKSSAKLQTHAVPQRD